MGKKSRRKKQWLAKRAARKRAAAGGPKLMDVNGITAKWRGGGCRHQNSAGGAYGLSANVLCLDCKMSIAFKLKFGRPKWFDAVMYNTASRMEASPVGRASVQGVHEFIIANAGSIYMPDGGADPEGGCPRRDALMLNILMDTLSGDAAPDAMRRTQPGDFAAAWRDIDCDHKSVSCFMFGHMVHVACSDCAADMQFMHLGGETFHVDLRRRPLESKMYGPHGAGEVAGFLREFAGTLDIPESMSDRMLHDPELDARRAADTVSALVECGLLRRAGPPETNFASIILDVSAAVCSRAEFDRQMLSVPNDVQDDGIEYRNGKRKISAREFMEMMRLEWPFKIEGVGINVSMYDPTCTAEYCARCGFDTLDDDSAGPEDWKNGCPECGYTGYLLGMD